MKNLTSFVLPHDAHWAIYAPSGFALLEQLKKIDAVVHQAEFVARKADLMPDGQADDTQDKPYDVWQGIAIISMCGPMTKAPTSFDDGCSTVGVRRQIRNAVRDDSVTAILLRIDSPGGSVSGTQDLANDVAQAVKKKPVYAYCEDYCCSAAYWVASQCEKIYSGPTAIVGSIGTYMVVQDMSSMADMMGIKVHVLSTGPQKGAGVPGSEITDGQITAFQKTVNDLNTHFLAAVSQGRHIRSIKAGEGVATGDVWIGAQAETAGLIDGVGSMDDVLQMMAAPKRGRPKTRESAEDANPGFAAGLAIGDLLAEQENEFVSSSALGSTMEHTLHVARAAVGGAIERVTQIKTLRTEQGRTIGRNTLSELRVLHSELGDLVADCQCLPTATDAAPEAAPDTTPNQAQVEARAALKAALARRIAS
jgi:signal peptide peptidase SppA